MKMSDVFDRKIDAGDISIFTGKVNEKYDDSVTAHECVANAINNHDVLVETLEKARQGYTNLIDLDLLPHDGYVEECRKHIEEMDSALQKAKS